MRGRAAGSRLLELVGLSGFALTQPILDTLGRSSGYLIFRGATRTALLTAAVLIALVPPLVLWVLTWRFTPAHRAVLAVLGAGIALVVFPDRWWTLAAAAVGGVAVYLLHARVPTFRSWLQVTAIGTPLFLFTLATSPAARSLDDVETEVRTARGNGAPVVMVVLDELPTRTLLDESGGIDPVRFPNLAALAGTSTWYRGATSVSPHTWHAVPAILTGQLPFESAPSVADHPDSLFTLLGDAYQLNVVESFERLCPVSLCGRDGQQGPETLDAVGIVGVGRRIWEERVGLREGEGTTGLVEPVVELDEQDRRGDDRPLEEILGDNHPQRFAELLAGIEATDQPVLHYTHILLPHAPWRYLPDGTLYEPGVEFGADGDAWGPQAWPTQLAQQRHRLQAQYVDRLIGELLDRLRATDLFDRALVVVVADHGVAFEPGDGRRAIEGRDYGPEVYADAMHVPLLVKAPGQRTGRVDDGNVLTVDVLPTIAALLDIEVPWDVDGMAADAAGSRGDEKPFFASTAGPFGVTPGEPRPQSAAALRPLLLRSLPPRADAADGLRDFRVGPSAGLIGGPIADVGGAVDITGDVTFIGGPVAVAGHVDRRVREGAVVAVSKGGTIVGTSPLFTHDGRPTFAVMAPPSLDGGGDGELRVHLLA